LENIQKKKNLFTFVFCSCSSCKKKGTYGSLGSGTTSTVPGGRRGSGTWVDSSGNLWLFGGFGYAAAASAAGEFHSFLKKKKNVLTSLQGNLNDMWMFNVNTSTWTWIHGPNSLNSLGEFNQELLSLSLFVLTFPNSHLP
jgi:hypothetical protein